ncbi:MAG TPA: basic secretory protein-like protein [Planctomycetota bacterium]|nr:basic secretory protein-like protein [Planctomycetota bacterium]
MRHLLLVAFSLISATAGETPLAVSSSLPTKGRQVAQLAFDGKAETSFSSDRPVRDGDDITIALSSAREVRSVQIATGTPDGKDKLAFGVLEVSDDGKNFRHAGVFKDGAVRVTGIDGAISAFRIRVTGSDGAALAVNEVTIGGLVQPEVKLVTRVNLHYETAPDAKKFALKAKELVDEFYPKLYTEFDTPEGPAPLTNVHLWFQNMDGVAYATNRNEIHISEKWVTKQSPEDYGMVIHEMFHLVQAYTGGGEGWLTEGLADYVRHQRFEPQANWGKPDPEKAKYTDAYKTTALFLEWVETQKQGIVVTLNAASRKKDNVREVFTRETGKDVDALWREYVGRLK